MEKLKHSSFKPLEVIWNRNTSNHNPKLLPELKGINIEDSVKKIKKSVKSLDVKINENKIENVHKRVKRSLFQENKKEKNDHSNSVELNKELCETSNCANNFRKRTYSINKTSELNLPDLSLKIISNRKKIRRNQDALIHKSKKYLIQTKSAKSESSSSHTVNDASVIKSSRNMDQKNLHFTVFNHLKSPEIMSNRKRFVMYNNLDTTNISSNDSYKRLLPIVQTPEKLNKKYKNINTHISKINSIHSEDIIESSEKIISPIKKKQKKCINWIHSKKTKKKIYTNESKVSECKTFNNGKSEINLPKNEIHKSTEISTIVKNEFCNKINSDSIDIINTENISEYPVTEFKSQCKKLKKSIIAPQKQQNRRPAETCIINNDNQIYYSDTSLTQSSFNTKEFVKNTVKEYSKISIPHGAKLFNQNENNTISFIHSSKINVIPATPEHESINVDDSAVQYSPETILSPYVPLIEVDQSPTTPNEKNCQVLIQSVQTPPNVDNTTSPSLFEPITSPTPSLVNELPFKIDAVESPRAVHENDDIFSPEIIRKKSDNSPSSPNCFNSGKKRKKMCKDGLRGKFRDLINRKKSEACIREYEKSLSKSYKPKQGESALLNVIEAWMEFRTIVLLCYYMKSDEEVQKVLVTLNNCSINAAKNSIIRIYSPWLTIKSEITEVLLFVGIIHAEVIAFSESITKPLKEKFIDINGLLTTVFQNKVLWECNCSKDAGCRCLGELSVYNYLQYMIPQ
ncbi:uncharacterized protein LOC112601031 [Melanaphis sacchari]|uniref:uncharacterized protein LOC112601031 n=1 Tax=Melanaphis sacchari TaxID=742174 RepID=UPI000DC14740|nr:uncharacterized protein LOC112601031 [Melanaphis sacchari]